MKILWYVNIVMPKAARKLNLKKAAGGGWLEGQADAISKKEGVTLTIVNITTAVNKIKTVTVDKVEYILLPTKEYLKSFKKVIGRVKPDLCHVHGTEYIYNTEIINYLADTGEKFTLSVQGLVHRCAMHYCDGLPEKYEKINPIVSFVGFLYYSDSIAGTKSRFEQQGIQEIKALCNSKNVIGRTDWDKKSVLEINPNVNYHHVDENLRECFYNGDLWCYEDCTKHSIFVSQGFYPIKGLHNLLYILPQLIKRYPGLTVRVGGQKAYTLGNSLLDVGVDYFFEYQSFIKKLIKQYRLEDYITFTGPLSAEEMRDEYLKSNIFLSCSTIENSPNSVAEAMILGAVVVASDVGGTSTLLRDGEGLLFTSLDKKEMYDKICYAFDNPEEIGSMAKNAAAHAAKTHDKKNNIETLLNVYDSIVVKEQ